MAAASPRFGDGPSRAVVVGDSTETLIDGLMALSVGKEHPAVALGVVMDPPPRIGFLCTGEGSERKDAGAGLVLRNASFAGRVRRLLGVVDREDLADLKADLGPWRHRHDSKLLLGALELGLAGLLTARGVVPAAVCGHSVGEYVAAAITGVISQEDALRLLDDLGRGLQDFEVEGGLALVQAPRAEVEAVLLGIEQAWVAVDNAPDWVGVSGTREGLKNARRVLLQAGIHARGLRVDQPVHGPALAALAPALDRFAQGILHQPPRCTWISTVTGGEVAGAKPGWWAQALVSPVRFREAWDAARSLPIQLWVEIGPKPALSLLTGRDRRVLSALDPRLDDAVAVERLLGWLWCHGYGAIDRVATAWPSLDRAEALRILADHTGRRSTLQAIERPRDLPAALRLAREVLGELLSRAPEPGLDEAGLFDLGLDSALALALAARLEERAGVRLSVLDVLGAGTILGLARRLLGVRRDVAVKPTAQRGPVAIIGAGLRLPGGISDLSGLWTMLAAGEDRIGQVPEGRWREPLPPGVPRAGAFLDEIDRFDPDFFGISPREAPHLDPVQRLLLECAWEAIEDAGVDPRALRDSATGVYVGVGPSDYGGSPRLNDPAQMEAWSGPGTEPSVAVGRLSYVLGLRGPAMALDTACSSSLVAIASAVRALQLGDCALALAGGASLLLSPSSSVWLSLAGALAPDGRCKAFSAEADGFGRGEGVALVLLKRLDEAVRDGDRVLGVIRGIAVNHDGASSGLTVPNPAAQRDLLETALSDAGISASEVDLVECHGTGTRLGDPVEVSALGEVFGDRDPMHPLRIGTLKSNLGHLEWAAGVAGVLKVLACLHHSALPPSLRCAPLNPLIDWEKLPVRVVDKLEPWEREGRPRRAGVSSFGISGTNAHVIVEEAPEVQAGVGAAAVGWRGAQAGPASTAEAPHTERHREVGGGFWPILVSAKTEEGLRAQAARWADWLSAHPDVPLVEVARTAALHRSVWRHRAVAVGRTASEVAQSLVAVAESGALNSPLLPGEGGAPQAGRVRAGAQPLAEARAQGLCVFLFTGQGSQRPGMGRDLAEAWPAFRSALHEVCEALDLHLTRPILDLMWAEESSDDASLLNRTEWAQPALFALEVALFRSWETVGIRPQFLLGHSIGELAAACCAGLWSLDDAARLVAARGRLMGALPEGGAMLALAISVEALAPVLQDFSGRVELAAVNGPESAVVSGEEAAIEEIHARLAEHRPTRLNVSHAFHSAAMDPMLEDFAAVARSLRYEVPQIPLVSGETGALATPEDLQNPGYWLRQVRRPVRFGPALSAAISLGGDTLLELGPQGVLCGLAAAVVGDEVRRIPSLRGRQSEEETFAYALGGLWLAGQSPDWAALLGTGRWAALPTTAFVRQPYWIEASSRSKVGTSLEDLRYRIAWRPVAAGAAEMTGAWAVVRSAAPQAEALAQPLIEALTAAGATAVEQVWGGDSAASELRARSPVGVLSLLALDEAPHPDASAVPSGLVETLALVQALEGSPAALWILTQSAVSTSPKDRLSRPLQAMCWGLGQVASLEQPANPVGLLDLPEDLSATDLASLAGALASGEDQVALRADGLYARRLVRAPRRNYSQEWRPTGTVLITGGTGGIGAHLCRWLASRGAEHLILLSRRGLNAPGARALVADLELLGARATVAAVDVADERALSGLLSDLDAADETLTAVFHAAGVLDDGLLSGLDAARLQRVVEGKVQGAWNLHQHTAARSLSAFVLFSSLSGTVGNEGQGNYAAANSALDALALQRRAAGLPALSVAWGPWADGERVDARMAERIARGGLALMAPTAALSVLGQALGEPAATLVVADIDLARFAPVYASARPRPLLTALPEAVSALKIAPAPQEGTLVASLRALPEAERRSRLVALVQTEVSSVLGLGDPGRVPQDRPLQELGLDSLMAVELRDRLSTRLGLRVQISQILGGATPDALARAVMGALYNASAPSDPGTETFSALPTQRPYETVPSPGQQRLYFLDQLTTRPELYNVHQCLVVERDLDAEVLAGALQALVLRHEQLRVGLREVGGQVRQQVLPWAEIPVVEHDLRHLSPSSQEARLQALSQEAAQSPFTLSRPPLLRLGLVHLTHEQSALLLTWHHAITDGSSGAVFLAELSEAYEAVAAGRIPEATPTPSYARYSEHLAQRREIERTAHTAWWQKQLTNAPILDLPTDHPRPATPSYRGRAARMKLPADLSDRIDTTARATGTTRFVLLLTAWVTLLHRLSGAEDLTVSFLSAGRPSPAFASVLGFFVNTLPLRCDLSGDPSFAELLQRVRASVHGVLEHEALPLDAILAACGNPRDADGSNPLLGVTFALASERWALSSFAGARARSIGDSWSGDVAGTAKFDLSLAMVRGPDGYAVSLEYAADLFEEGTIQRWTGHLQTLLSAVVGRTDRRLSELSVLSDAELQQLLVEWNDTETPVPELPLHALFEAQARRVPDAVAAVFKDETLSYIQLNAAANRLAHRLRALGVGPEVRVGIGLHRGLELLVALLAVLKAGGAYVPLDPTYPEARIRHMAEDADLALILTHSEETLPRAYRGSRLDLDLLDLGDAPVENPTLVGTSDNLAYIIYTSGSTGTPKGVCTSHRNAVNAILEECRRFGFTSGTRVLQFASFNFDASVIQTFAPLAAGACVVLASPTEREDAAALARLLNRQRVEVADIPPAMLPHLVHEPFEALRVLVVGGEACAPSVAAPLAEGRRFVNAYGPTETTIASTYWEGDPNTRLGGALPLGRPNANTRLYVLDEQGLPVPIGVPGELYIGGLGLARGYLGHPGLTAARFVPDPFGPPGGRLYRSGDRVRWSANGELNFLGRFDHQVKIRGLRVELGEIEAALLALPGVAAAVVVAREHEPGGARLVAYLVGEALPKDDALRRLLGATLPEWMVPSAFVTLAALPLSPSGKVDRAALPAPEREAPSVAFVAPRTPVETTLAEIWSDVLGLQSVGVEDNFFTLGGDSIRSIQVVSRAAKVGLALAVRDLFAHPTIAAQANLLAPGRGADEAKPGCLVRLRDGDAERPLVCLAPLLGSLHAFQHLARALRPGLPVWVMEAPEVAGLPDSPDTVTALAQLYIAELLPLLSTLGPLRLAGYSFGGVVALELARLLLAQGVAIETLLMVDSGAPGLETDKGLDELEELGALARHVGLKPGALDGLDAEHRVQHIAHALREFEEPGQGTHGEEYIHNMVRAMHRNRDRLRGWSGEAPGMPVTLIVSQESGRTSPDLGWTPVLGSTLTVVPMGGDHVSLTQPPLATTLARLMEAQLSPPPGFDDSPSPNLLIRVCESDIP